MDSTWGNHLNTTEIYGRQTDPKTYKAIEPGDKNYISYQHASHVLLYALTDKIALSKYPRKAIVLMQMRFDGYLGFPGGEVDSEETPAQAVNRELVEEIAYNYNNFGKVSDSNHLFSHVNEADKMVLHFFAKKLTEIQIEEVVKGSVLAADYGDESLGLFFVPLYTMDDSFRGFPAFLRQKFAGNAQFQLTAALVALNILTEAQVEEAFNA